MKETSLTLKFKRIGNGTLRELRIVVPHDAGWAKRKSGHSQAGALFALTHKDLLEGKTAKVTTFDWFSNKVTRVVRSSYACEMHASLMALDRLDAVLCLIHQFWFGWDAKAFRQNGPIFLIPNYYNLA